MSSDALASIALSFGIGAGVGQDAEGSALDAAGLPRRQRLQPRVFPFHLPPLLLPASTLSVGSFVILPATAGVGTGWFWDITSLSASGFTAGSIAVTKAAPAVTAAGSPVAIEYITSFVQAGIIAFPQKGNPLLDANDDLYFTVTAAVTAPAGVTFAGTAIMVPVTRIDDYLS